MNANNFMPRHDQDAPNLSRSQASSNSEGGFTRTHYSDGRERSRTSLHSYRSVRDLSVYVKEVDGRMYNNSSDIYLLPSDQAEWDRLDKQHYAFMLAFGTLYPLAVSDAVARVLTPGPGPAKAVVDLGCGTAIWTLEMAASFPEATVVGVDLAPSPIEQATTPETCHYELDNFDLGLAHFLDQFDFVHARGLSMGISDYIRFMLESFLCLLPGGIAVFGEVDWTIYQEDRLTPVAMGSETHPEGSWLQKILHEAKEAASNNGSDMIDIAKTLSEGLWGNEDADPATCKTACLYLPIGPNTESLPKSKKIEKLASLMTESMKILHRSLERLLIESGIAQQDLENWSSEADKELETCQDIRWVRFDFAWGQRKAERNQPVQSPPPPQLPRPVPHPVRGSRDAEITRDILEEEPEPYPYLFVYDTLEESLEAADIRIAARNPS